MKKILIIEDSKTINNIIKKELDKLGFDVSQAFALKEAKKLLSNDRYDLIILDLHLPDGEGSELIAHIQSLTKTKVVVLTSVQDEDLREELFGYGILDYIIKDTNLLYSVAEIVKIVHKVDSEAKEKILIIDDSRFICKQVKTILEPRNYEVKYSLNAKKGLEKLRKEKFDLLVLDMELPDLHGLEVLKILRKDSKFMYLPIIVLSGTSTSQIIRESLKNGASDFLRKPFIFEEFILKVDLWIDYFKKEIALEKKSIELKFLNDNLEKLVVQKVDENQKKDKMMFQQSRQAQMGEMIAMIAHQWRQPLNAISAAISLIDQKVQIGKFDVQTSKKISLKMYKYIEYLSSTIDDFRNFFKPDKEMAVTDFETICQKALTLIEISLYQRGIVLEKNIHDVEKFIAYENELIQVVINLLKNAEDILMEKKISNPKIIIEIKGAVLSIEDNAGGVPQSIIDKIFDPYFSTKNSKEGTGLGLYMSKMIVQEHCCGYLSVCNTEQGAKFIIDMSKRDKDGK
jgi:DNA-binding response OmpR family regulator